MLPAKIHSPGIRERWKSDRSLWGKLIYSSSQRRCSKLSIYMEAKKSGKDQKKNPLWHLKGLSHGSLVPHLQQSSAPVCQRKADSVPLTADEWSVPGHDRRATTRICLHTVPQWLKGKQGKQLQLPCVIAILNCWTLQLESNNEFQFQFASAFFSNLLFPIFSENIQICKWNRSIDTVETGAAKGSFKCTPVKIAAVELNTYLLPDHMILCFKSVGHMPIPIKIIVTQHLIFINLTSTTLWLLQSSSGASQAHRSPLRYHFLFSLSHSEPLPFPGSAEACSVQEASYTISWQPLLLISFLALASKWAQTLCTLTPSLQLQQGHPDYLLFLYWMLICLPQV